MKALRWIPLGSTALVLPLLLTQCALPPREAWRTIQSKGLLTYLSTTTPGGHYGTPYRPDMLGSGLRYSNEAYRNRYVQSTPYQRYSSAPVPLRPTTSSSSPRSSSASSATASAKPKPKPTPRSEESSRQVAQRSASSSSSALATKPKKEVKSESVASSAPAKPSSPTTAPSAPPKTQAELPYGKTVSGRPGLVTSPYAGSSQLVDVTGMSAGQPVKCPYTGKLFKVPAQQEAKGQGSDGE